MLALRCTLLRDTFEGGEPEVRTRAEWPPSWMRLFSALVAVANHKASQERRLLERLETWPPPYIYATPLSSDGVEFLRTAWVPINSIPAPNKAGSTALVGRQNLERAWARAVPRSPVVMYTWPDVALENHEQALLNALCRRVPYLGRSTCPVVVEVVSDPDLSGECLVPASAVRENEAFTVLCSRRAPYEGALQALERAYNQKNQGKIGDPWAIGTYVDYGLVERPTASDVAHGPYRDLVILALEGPIRDGRHAVYFTDLLRKALIANASRSIAAVHGHQQGDVVQCAFLALPFVGHPHADGHIVGLAIAVPELPADDLAVINMAIERTTHRGLSSPALGQFGLRRLSALELRRARLALQPGRWNRAARRWVTVYPAVLDRYLKRRDDPEQLARHTIVNAGYPEPEHVELSLRPFTALVPGAVDLAPEETLRPGHREGFRPYRHLLITFPFPVRGPLVVGAMRHYGLGLCLPLQD